MERNNRAVRRSDGGRLAETMTVWPSEPATADTRPSPVAPAGSRTESNVLARGSVVTRAMASAIHGGIATARPAEDGSPDGPADPRLAPGVVDPRLIPGVAAPAPEAGDVGTGAAEDALAPRAGTPTPAAESVAAGVPVACDPRDAVGDPNTTRANRPGTGAVTRCDSTAASVASAARFTSTGATISTGTDAATGASSRTAVDGPLRSMMRFRL